MQSSPKKNATTKINSAFLSFISKSPYYIYRQLAASTIIKNEKITVIVPHKIIINSNILSPYNIFIGIVSIGLYCFLLIFADIFLNRRKSLIYKDLGAARQARRS